MTPPRCVIWVGLRVRNYEILVRHSIAHLPGFESNYGLRDGSARIQNRDIIRTKFGTLECFSTWGLSYLEGDSVALVIVLA